MLKKILFISVICCVNGFSNSAYSTYNIYHTNPTYVNSSMLQLNNTEGKYTITATQVAGAAASTVANNCSMLPATRYSSSSVVLPNKMVLKNKRTSSSYTVPVRMTNSTGSGNGYYVRSIFEYKTWNPGPIPCGTSSTLVHTTTSEAIAVFEFRGIPGGEYTSDLKFGALNCQGTDTTECDNGILALAASGYTGTGTVVKLDIIVPDTVTCNASADTINHGIITIDKVNGNLKSGSLVVTCTGATSYTITTKQNNMDNTIPIYNGMNSKITVNDTVTNTFSDKIAGAGYKQYQLWSTLQTTKQPPTGKFSASGIVKIVYQ